MNTKPSRGQVVSRTFVDRGIYGYRITVLCSCGMQTVQRACDGAGDLCGRCGYLSDDSES